MALSIKSEEADRLARELARRTGETMTEAVTVALRERLKLVPERPGKASAERILELAQAMWAGLENKSPITKAEFDELTEG